MKTMNSHTLSSRPNSLRSAMNILPARMGPTVCELLGPTRRQDEFRRRRRLHEKLTTNTKKVERGDDSMAWFDGFNNGWFFSLVQCKIVGRKAEQR